MRALAFALVLLVAAPACLAKAPAPAWSVGDSWTTLLHIPPAVPGGNGTTESRPGMVQAFETIVVNGSSRDAARVVGHHEENATFPDGTTMHSATDDTTWYQVSDLALLQEHQTTTVTYTGGPAAPPARTFEHNTTYGTPCDGIPFPLDVGQRWTSHCDQTSTSSSPGSVPSTTTADSTNVVEALEKVTVPAGTFDAYRINRTETDTFQDSTDTVAILLWYAPSACNIAKSQSTTTNSLDGTTFQSTEELAAFTCAKAGSSNGGSTGSTTTTTTSPASTTPTNETPTPATKSTGVPGPEIGLTLAGIAAVAVLAARRRA